MKQKLKDALGAVIGTFLGLTGLIFFLDFETAPMSKTQEELNEEQEKND